MINLNEPVRSLALYLFLAVIISGCAITKNEQFPPHPVDKAVIQTIRSLGAGGGSIAIRVDGKEIYTSTYGSGYKLGKPKALASLSKPVTAFIILQMEKDGILSTSDKVISHVPEIKSLKNYDRLVEVRLADLMTHNSGLGSEPSYSFSNWKQRLNSVLNMEPVYGRSYANDNYTLLTRVIINNMGSYENALKKYINIDGVSTFRIGRYHGIPSYAGVGELEASSLDYLKFMEKSAPLSKGHGGFGYGWFHHRRGYLNHLGAHDLKNGKWHAYAIWNAKAQSGATVSFVFQASGLDLEGKVVRNILSAL